MYEVVCAVGDIINILYNRRNSQSGNLGGITITITAKRLQQPPFWLTILIKSAPG